jgi:hypothetical protein
MARNVQLSELKAVKSRLQNLIQRTQATAHNQDIWHANYQDLVQAHRALEHVIQRMESLPGGL